jgi:hypothetical protein
VTKWNAPFIPVPGNVILGRQKEEDLLCSMVTILEEMLTHPVSLLHKVPAGFAYRSVIEITCLHRDQSRALDILRLHDILVPVVGKQIICAVMIFLKFRNCNYSLFWSYLSTRSPFSSNDQESGLHGGRPCLQWLRVRHCQGSNGRSSSPGAKVGSLVKWNYKIKL